MHFIVSLTILKLKRCATRKKRCHGSTSLCSSWFDWFVTQQQIDVWYDDDDVYNDDEMIKWCNGYKTQKAQKAKIKEEFLPIAWHSDRVMDRQWSGTHTY